MGELNESLERLGQWPVLEETVRERTIGQILRYYAAAKPDANEVAVLAQAMADSGVRWEWPEACATADVPSTGGPGSLSTLLCPPILAAYGVWVPKLGVRGATAGAIDVMEIIPGYSADVTRAQAALCLRQSGMAHCVGTDRLCPADRDMFAARTRSGMKAVHSLIAASLLSKKLAVGCSAAALDVRCGPSGNAGSTVAECVAFSQMFCQAAAHCGIHVTCLITPVDPPATRFFGRWESLNATVAALSGDLLDPWTSRHLSHCLRLADMAYSNSIGTAADVAPIGNAERILGHGTAYEKFLKNIQAQGGSESALHDCLRSPFSRHVLTARAEGYMQVDPAGVRRALNTVNEAACGHADLAGVTLLVEPGEYVNFGDSLACIRYRKGLPTGVEEALAFEIEFVMLTVDEHPGAAEQAPFMVSAEGRTDLV